jgi:flagellin
MLSKERLNTPNLARAGIGTSTSRIDTAISNLTSMTQNIASASSQITDTDVSEESAKLVASQILQQAGTAILAQENAQPELTLQLIRSV